MHEQLMETVVSTANCWAALEAAERNQGAPGMDGMTTGELRNHLRKHWPVLRDKLLKGGYVPSPVRRVEIPKPNGGVRPLGIPTVQDRFIQPRKLSGQAMTPIYEPRFSQHSHGFRPGRSAHDAVRAAQAYAREGKDWVVDMDITGFFDHVNHDILMERIGQTIRDKRVLALIGRYLRAGVMLNGVVVRNEEGTPQGGPRSPLLANIYLDALDRELERRGHAFSRYADDCNIYVRSEAAAARVLASVRQWIERHLKLEVNAAKSGTDRVWERKFLGFTTNRRLEIEVAATSLARFKGKVRQLWRSCQSVSSEKLRDGWCAYLRGWWGYYRLAENRRPIFAMEGWIRRHVRACFWQRWHSVKGRLAALKRLGLSGWQLKVAHSGRGAWPIAASASLQTALGNAVLKQYGFLMPSELAGS
jgi:group II intron reverse transcriptase/maturase